ncbi:MAG: hypothetical protein Q9160_003235 [Pyrenula sp. 1 TL-2023]
MSFHILVAAPEAEANICRSVLSAAFLKYPSPALVNQAWKDSELGSGSRAETRRVYDFLQNEQKLDDEDLILVLRGHESWFQLPPEILINRFFDITKAGSARLRSQYGTTLVSNMTKPMFSQRILFGVDKDCESDKADDLACAAIPYAPSPDNSWAPLANRDSEDLQNKPHWLNPGTILARVSDMRALYSRAMEKVSSNGEARIFSSIFGEQEYMREVTRQSKTNGWLDWLASKMGSGLSVPNITNLHFEPEQDKAYDFGIGLDYKSELFFPVTPFQEDAEWLSFNGTAASARILEEHGKLSFESFDLPLDVKRLHSPFESFATSQEHGSLPSSPSIELSKLSFSDLSLVANMQSATVAPILQLDRDNTANEALLDSWWQRMWYYIHAKAFLGTMLQSPSSIVSVTVKSTHEIFSWEVPGGEKEILKGNDQWHSWENLCGQYEKKLSEG